MPGFRTTTRIRWIPLALLAALALSACAGGGTPGQAVEAYLQALVDGDETAAVNRSCAAWEASARTESSSFEAVEASLQEVSCQESGSSPDGTLVACRGSIEAVYDGEAQRLALEGRTYLAVLEDGEWKMCGYPR
jgi:hypothetical protein